MTVMVHRSKVDIQNLDVTILNAKLSTDNSVTGLVQTSSNSVIKLADKVAILEIKKKKTETTQTKKQISNLEVQACFLSWKLDCLRAIHPSVLKWPRTAGLPGLRPRCLYLVLMDLSSPPQRPKNPSPHLPCSESLSFPHPHPLSPSPSTRLSRSFMACLFLLPFSSQ